MRSLFTRMFEQYISLDVQFKGIGVNLKKVNIYHVMTTEEVDYMLEKCVNLQRLSVGVDSNAWDNLKAQSKRDFIRYEKATFFKNDFRSILHY